MGGRGVHRPSRSPPGGRAGGADKGRTCDLGGFSSALFRTELPHHNLELFARQNGAGVQFLFGGTPARVEISGVGSVCAALPAPSRCPRGTHVRASCLLLAHKARTGQKRGFEVWACQGHGLFLSEREGWSCLKRRCPSLNGRFWSRLDETLPGNIGTIARTKPKAYPPGGLEQNGGDDRPIQLA